MSEPIDWDQVVQAWRTELAEQPDSLTWVSLPEAEQATGVSRSTLRSWYRSGQIPSRLEPGPHGAHRLVPRELVMERALVARGRLTRPEREPDSAPEAVKHAIEVVLQQAAEREQRLEARLVEAGAALRQALERAVTAETELRLRRKK